MYRHKRSQDFRCGGALIYVVVILKFGILNGIGIGDGDNPLPENF